MDPTTMSSFEIGNNMGTWLIDMFEKAFKDGYHLIWSLVIKPILVEHWFAILLVILILFVYHFTVAMMGKWGPLGSFIYNILYFGILLIIILIWGTDVLLDDFFDFARAVILYPVCYVITGWFLDKFNFRRYY